MQQNVKVINIRTQVRTIGDTLFLLATSICMYIYMYGVCTYICV